GCEASGQYIPFKATKAERLAAGDPRPSVEERYHSYPQYRAKVIQAVDKLVKARFLLCEDTDDMVTRLFAAGVAAGVPAGQAGKAWDGNRVAARNGNGHRKNKQHFGGNDE